MTMSLPHRARLSLPRRGPNPASSPSSPVS